MARIHILEGSGLNTYTVIVHGDVPAGNNVAGFPWSDCIKNSGRNTTQMTVGTGPGQITNAEQNQIVNGTVVEAVFQWQNDPAWTAAERNASLDLYATRFVAELLADLQTRLRVWGITRA
jgi:hypothetical protein